jgi:hypothetical protein
MEKSIIKQQLRKYVLWAVDKEGRFGFPTFKQFRMIADLEETITLIILYTTEQWFSTFWILNHTDILSINCSSTIAKT